MRATGPWPAFMADYTGGVELYIDGVAVASGTPVRGLNFPSGTTIVVDADTGIATVTVAGAAGATGATGPQGATGATGPGA